MNPNLLATVSRSVFTEYRGFYIRILSEEHIPTKDER